MKLVSGITSAGTHPSFRHSLVCVDHGLSPTSSGSTHAAPCPGPTAVFLRSAFLLWSVHVPTDPTCAVSCFFQNSASKTARSLAAASVICVNVRPRWWALQELGSLGPSAGEEAGFGDKRQVFTLSLKRPGEPG